MMETVLLACAVETEALAIRETLSADFDVIHFLTEAALVAYLTQTPDQSDVVILDSTISPNGMVACVESVRRLSPMVVVILLMDLGRPQTMVDSVKAGVTEIIAKPYYQSILLLAVRHAFEQSTLVGHLHRQLAMVSDQSIRRRIDAFCEFLMRRLHLRQSVTPSEIQLFFPGAKTPSVPLDQLLDILKSDTLKILGKSLKYRPKAIVVEDEPVVRTLLTRVLSREFEVTAFPNVEAALDMLNQPGFERIDLALLDIGLPGVSGDDCISQVKRRQPDISIMMVTGFTEHRLIVKTLQAGADDYITKPFNNHELLEKASRHVQSRLTVHWLSHYLGGVSK